ncbi:hypothetical protein PVAND_017256 [Polypedilum vanderplanki]|uniref:Trans-1,2-dihydrobenzene-1,2-diol dehydrogenase n=1 Tax=Polypedilum vanderplanki TaxID=319348 RepID=A0A9J6BHJ9_POLVA|nr:hypothetical protein PVAND_017256 [Polypedilum vanderplanki]
MSKPLRWGIVSAGKIANDFCAALSTFSNEEHQVVAVAARKEADAKEFAETFNIPKYYEGYEKLANDNEVDAVYIGSINTCHLEDSIMMLDAGKPVLCEKPFALNEKQSVEIFNRAKEKKLFCMEAVWSRFLPSYEYMRHRLDNNDFGEITEVEIEYGKEKLGKMERVVKKDLGGSMLLDIGNYAIQFAQFVFRSYPTSIKATGKLNDDGVDVEAEIELKYLNGGVAKIKTSAINNLKNQANIYGSKGSMTVDQFWACTYLIDIDGHPKEWKLPEPKQGEFVFNNRAGLRFQAEETRRCINEGKLESDLMPQKETIEIARIRDEIRKQIGVRYDED